MTDDERILSSLWGSWTRFDLNVSGIYRLRDSDGRFLYVGQSQNHPATRLVNHHTKPWWNEVRIAEFAIVGTAGQPETLKRLDELERAAIRCYDPPYNITHRPLSRKRGLWNGFDGRTPDYSPDAWDPTWVA